MSWWEILLDYLKLVVNPVTFLIGVTLFYFRDSIRSAISALTSGRDVEASFGGAQFRLTQAGSKLPAEPVVKEALNRIFAEPDPDRQIEIARKELGDELLVQIILSGIGEFEAILIVLLGNNESSSTPQKVTIRSLLKRLPNAPIQRFFQTAWFMNRRGFLAHPLGVVNFYLFDDELKLTDAGKVLYEFYRQTYPDVVRGWQISTQVPAPNRAKSIPGSE